MNSYEDEMHHNSNHLKELIHEIGFVQHINKPKNARKIPVTVYEELKLFEVPRTFSKYKENVKPHQIIKWIDNNGTNTPYLVTVI